MDNNLILGLVEDVKINGTLVKAKVDTGADRSSICKSLIVKLNLIPTGKKRIVRSSNGTEKRDIYLAEIEIKDKKFNSEFTTSKRNHLTYSVLIGKDILKKGFMIDPSR